MIQSTYDRMLKICPNENIYVVNKFCLQATLPDPTSWNCQIQIFYEPTMRNTAPCIAYASFKIHNINPNASMIIAASDHLIPLKKMSFVKL